MAVANKQDERVVLFASLGRRKQTRAASPPIPRPQDRRHRRTYQEEGAAHRAAPANMAALLRTQLERLAEYRQALISAAVTGQLDISKEVA